MTETFRSLQGLLESTNRDLNAMMDGGPTGVPVNIVADFYSSLITQDTIEKMNAGIAFQEELKARGITSLLQLANARFGNFSVRANTHVLDWGNPLHRQWAFCETRILMARKGCDWADGEMYCIECGDSYTTIIANEGHGYAFCSRHTTPEWWDVERDYMGWPNAWRLHHARIYFKLKEQGLADA